MKCRNIPSFLLTFSYSLYLTFRVLTFQVFHRRLFTLSASSSGTIARPETQIPEELRGWNDEDEERVSE